MPHEVRRQAIAVFGAANVAMAVSVQKKICFKLKKPAPVEVPTLNKFRESPV